MSSRPVIGAVVALACTAACSSASPRPPAGSTSVPASVTTSVTVTTPSSPTTFGGVVGKAATDACLTDAQTVSQASDIYQATHGAPAPSIAALVADGHLKEAPSNTHGYVIQYDPHTGKVTATGACRYP